MLFFHRYKKECHTYPTNDMMNVSVPLFVLLDGQRKHNINNKTTTHTIRALSPGSRSRGLHITNANIITIISIVSIIIISIVTIIIAKQHHHHVTITTITTIITIITTIPITSTVSSTTS